MRPVGLAAVSRARCARVVPAKLVLTSASSILSSSSAFAATTGTTTTCRFSRHSYSTLSAAYIPPSCRNHSNTSFSQDGEPSVPPQTPALVPVEAASKTPTRSTRRERTLVYLRSRRNSAHVQDNAPGTPLRHQHRQLQRPNPSRRFHSSRHQRQQDSPRQQPSASSSKYANATEFERALREMDTPDEPEAPSTKPDLYSKEKTKTNLYSKEKLRDWVAARKQRRQMRQKLLDLSRERSESTAPIHVLGSDPRATYIAHHLSHKPGGNPVCLMLPTYGARKRWDDEGGRITLVRGGKLEYSKEIFTEHISISKNFMWRINRNPAKDYRVHTLIYHLVVTLPCRNTIRMMSRLAHRIGPWTTICLIQNGLGVAELLNRTVFRGENRAPSYVMGHMSHDLGYDPEKYYTVRELKPGLLRLASYMPYGSHFDRKNPDEQEADPTPRWGEHEHRLQRRLWKPDQRRIAGGATNWRHRRRYRRLGTSKTIQTTRPHYVSASRGSGEKQGENTADDLQIIEPDGSEEDAADEFQMYQHGDENHDIAGAEDREYPTDISISRRERADHSAGGDDKANDTQAGDGDSSQPMIVYAPGKTRRPSRMARQTFRAYEFGRRRRQMLTLDVRKINAKKILAQNRPRYMIIYMLATTPKLFAGRYSLYSVYRRKLPEMIYTAAFEPVATVMQLPISRATWAHPVVRTLILGIIDELLAVITWIPELLKSYKLRHDIQSGMLRRRVLNEFYRRTRPGTITNMLMGYEDHDEGYQSRALGRLRRGGMQHPIGGLGDAAHSVMEQLVAVGMTTDIQYLNGYFVRRAQQIGIQTPQNQMIIRMLEVRMMINRDQTQMFVPIVGNAYLNSGDSPDGRRSKNRYKTIPEGTWKSAKGLFNHESSSRPRSKNKSLSEPTIVDPETSDYGEFDILDALPQPPDPAFAKVKAKLKATKNKPRSPKWDKMSPVQADQTLRRYYKEKNESQAGVNNLPTDDTRTARTGGRIEATKRPQTTSEDSIYGDSEIRELRNLGYVNREGYALQRDKRLGKEIASEITLRLQNADDAEEELLQHLDEYLEKEVLDEPAATPPQKSYNAPKKRNVRYAASDPDEPAPPQLDDEDASIARYYGDDSSPAAVEQREEASPLASAITDFKQQREAMQKVHRARLDSLKNNFITNPVKSDTFSNSKV
ncbi:2-dehydropantoate 2-reductase [Ophiostoma piceae UAMH 11346]|uniref:2-dehydropantoate 2-reductase n=1 Tax=Ophiostoma piceae (strain UAMH 11346) TaxID=1262450 RepID=S3C955_OPHP1|nr:2-dehydropantoate 2-reductase [Ophiostoma piceae UAMH 11346]